MVEYTRELRERLDELKTRRDEVDKQLKLLEDKVYHFPDYIYGEFSLPGRVLTCKYSFELNMVLGGLVVVLISQFQKEIVILELTVCHETNLLKSRSYKVNKYCNISDNRKRMCLNRTVKVFTCEVSTLGLISDTASFCKAVKLSNLSAMVKQLIIKSASSNSHYIYCNRNCSDEFGLPYQLSSECARSFYGS